MTDAKLEETVLRLLSRIAPETDPTTLDRNEPLQKALDIDSYDFLNLLVAVRDELGVSIDESDYGKAATLGGMVELISSRLGASRARD